MANKTCILVQMLFTSVSPGPSEFGNKLYSPALNHYAGTAERGIKDKPAPPKDLVPVHPGFQTFRQYCGPNCEWRRFCLLI
jgi:hypothetical protein